MEKLKNVGCRISDVGFGIFRLPQLVSSLTALKKWFVETQIKSREKSVKICGFFCENLREICSPILPQLVPSLTALKKWFVKTQTTAKEIQTTVKKANFQTSNFSFLTFFLLFTFNFLPITNHVQSQTLDDYLVLAAENNPGLKASYSRYQASLERNGQVSLPDPELRVGFFLRPMERFMGNQQADIQLMQMFPWFGMLAAQKEEANHMALAQYQLFLEDKNQLFFQIKSTWYELHRLKEEMKIGQENLEFLKKYERLALIKYQAAAPNSASSPSASTSVASGNPSSSSTGASSMNSMGGTSSQMSSPSQNSMSGGMASGSGSSMSDVLRIRIEMKELENNLAQLEANFEPLQIKFNQLLNRDILEEIKLLESLQPASLDGQKMVILDSIKSTNPMLAMYDSEMAAYDQQARMAKLDGRPMLGAGVNYMPFKPRIEDGMMMGGENMVMPMVTMTLPIYRKKTNAKIKEAEYLKEATLLTRQKTENLLTMEWANAFRDWEDAERKIKLYTDQVELVNQTINLLLTSYTNSGQDFTEVLRAQQLLLDYQLKRINAINQQYQSLAMLDMLGSTTSTLL